MHIGKLTQINLYPIKSTATLSVSRSSVLARGLEYDRRWMLVDHKGLFLTQRKLPRMALIKTSLAGDSLLVSAPEMTDLLIPYEVPDQQKMQVKIWRDDIEAKKLDDAYAEWFEEFLGIKCHLVFMDASIQRLIDPGYAKQEEQVSFADGFPLLLATQQSLDDVNKRMEDEEVDMRRFRPNLVIDGDNKAFAEDDWKQIQIGTVVFDIVKPCSRCVMTTIDPDTGLKSEEGVPLTTLKQYRSDTKGIYFGQNMIPRNEGVLRVGDSVTLLV